MSTTKKKSQIGEASPPAATLVHCVHLPPSVFPFNTPLVHSVFFRHPLALSHPVQPMYPYNTPSYRPHQQKKQKTATNTSGFIAAPMVHPTAQGVYFNGGLQWQQVPFVGWQPLPSPHHPFVTPSGRPPHATNRFFSPHLPPYVPAARTFDQAHQTPKISSMATTGFAGSVGGGHPVPKTATGSPLDDLFCITPWGMFCMGCSNENSPARVFLNRRSVDRHLKIDAHIAVRSHLRLNEVKNFLSEAYRKQKALIDAGDHESFVRKRLEGWICPCGAAFEDQSVYRKHVNNVSGRKKCVYDVNNRKRIVYTACGQYLEEEFALGGNSTALLSTTTTTTTMTTTTTRTVVDRRLDFTGGCEDSPTKFAPLERKVTCFDRESEHPVALGDIIDGIIAKHEDSANYVSIFLPLALQVGQYSLFLASVRERVELWCKKEDPTDSDLNDLLASAKKWLLGGCALHSLEMTPGNVRARIMIFDSNPHNQNQGHLLTFRKAKEKLWPELRKLMLFVHRKGHSKISTGSDLVPRTVNVIPAILHNLHLEKSPVDSAFPLIVEYCVSRMFRDLRSDKEEDELRMRACGETGSVLSTILHLIRLGVCSHCNLCELSHKESLKIAEKACESKSTNLISPWIRRMKEMHKKKPEEVKISVDEVTGDIAIESCFYFAKKYWSKLIPNTVSLAVEYLRELLDGEQWLRVLDCSLAVCVSFQQEAGWVFALANTDGSYSVTSNNLKFQSRSDAVLLRALDALASVMEFSFHGFGGGGFRESEVRRIPEDYLNWHRGTFYYPGESQKRGALFHKEAKVVEHKLPPRIARVYLLFIAAANTFKLRDGFAVYHKRVAPLELGSILKNLCALKTTRTPDLRHVRKLWASLAGLIYCDDRPPASVTCEEVANQHHHSLSTQQTKSYSPVGTWSHETLMNTWHVGLGGSLSDSLVTKEISLGDILLVLRRLFGDDAEFKSVAQQCLVESTATRKNVFATLECGGGKSLAWVLPLVANRLLGRGLGSLIVVLPYVFLAHFQFDRLREDINEVVDAHMVFLSTDDIREHSLPEEFWDNERMPDIIFTYPDAMAKLIQFHEGNLRMWASQGILHRVFIDEVHTLLAETHFRTAFDDFRDIAAMGIPVTILTGTMPVALQNHLCYHLNLCERGLEHEMIQLNSHTITGVFPDGFGINIKKDSGFVELAIERIHQVLRGDDERSIHVVVATKDTATSVGRELWEDYGVRVVTSDTTDDEMKKTAMLWRNGYLQVLVTTSLGLVGNESTRCNRVFVIGYLYDLMQVVQAMGRLRPSERKAGGSIEFFVPPVLYSSPRQNDDGAMLRQRLLAIGRIGSDFVHLNRVVGQRTVFDWTNEGGCRVVSLHKRFGMDANDCHCCDNCLLSGNRIVGTRFQNERETAACYARHAQSVITSLLERCSSCRQEHCPGIGIGSCFSIGICLQCGDAHHRKHCPISKRREQALESLMGNRGCWTCWDLRDRPGYLDHQRDSCPLKERLRRLFFDSWMKLPNHQKWGKGMTPFRYYLNHLSSLDNFQAFLASHHHTLIKRPYKTKFYFNCRQHEGTYCRQNTDPTKVKTRVPLLPPDLYVYNNGRFLENEYLRFDDVETARSAGEARIAVCRKTQNSKRCYIFGALYKNILPGYARIDVRDLGPGAEIHLNVKYVDKLDKKERTSVIVIRNCSGNKGMLDKALALCQCLDKKPGNTTRGKEKTGDFGKMFALGWKNTRNQVEYSANNWDGVSDAMRELSLNVSSHMQQVAQNVFNDMKQATIGVPSLDSMGGNKGVGSCIMLSQNLINSSHNDVFDSSKSWSLWVEYVIGQAKDWCFICPNIELAGSLGVVVVLFHGISIEWDGRVIDHCSSVGDLEESNNVFGIMFGCCRVHDDDDEAE